MKKTLYIFCDFYLPSVRAGGPLRSVVALVELLKSEFDITVVTRNHDLCVRESYKNIITGIVQQRDDHKVLYLYEENSIREIKKLIGKSKINIAYFNSFFSPKFSVIPQFFFKIFSNKTRVIVSPRGELGNGALSIKNIRKKFYIKLFNFLYSKNHIEFLASSENEKQDIEKIFHQKYVTTKIDNIVTAKNVSVIFNTKKENYLKIIFVSRISYKKNLHFALKILKDVTTNIEFDIYGLIEDVAYWKQCEEMITQLPKNITVKYCGELHPDGVIETIKNYDLFFLPTLNENYGYAIVESLSSACPVLLSDQTPWKFLTEKNAGWAFALSQPDLFSKKIDELANEIPENYLRYKQGALDYYLKNIVNQNVSEQYRMFFNVS